jgi:ribosomal 50S subunit-recycling heat shock protein
LRLLETRLDNVVRRLGFATSPRAARQLVSHNHVTVNGKTVDISSYQVKPGDRIALVEGLRANLFVKRSLHAASQRGLPAWLEWDGSVAGAVKGSMDSISLEGVTLAGTSENLAEPAGNVVPRERAVHRRTLQQIAEPLFRRKLTYMTNLGLVLPQKLEAEAAGETHGKFVAEPFERGYGHTVGHSLKRILLSSLEGAAVTAVRIKGAPHEFSSLKGVQEDVITLIQNLRQLRFPPADGRAPNC